MKKALGLLMALVVIFSTTVSVFAQKEYYPETSDATKKVKYRYSCDAYTVVTWENKKEVHHSLLETDDGAWVKWKGYFFNEALYDLDRNLICRYRRDAKGHDFLFFSNNANVNKVSLSGGVGKNITGGILYCLTLDGCDDCTDLWNDKNLIDSFYNSAK